MNLSTIVSMTSGVSGLKVTIGVEAVPELGAEKRLQRLAAAARVVSLARGRRPKPMVPWLISRDPALEVMIRIDLAEVGLAPGVVGEGGVVHHLQQDVEQVGVRLLDLVEEHHAVGVLAHRVHQQAALLEAHVARAARR